jgi:hypothetical protein
MADSTEGMAWSSWGQVLLSFFAVVLIYLTLRESQKATQAAGAAVEAALDAADSARKQVEHNRAFMTVAELKAIRMNNALVPSDYRIRLAWENSGDSPARQINCAFRCDITPTQETRIYGQFKADSEATGSIGRDRVILGGSEVISANDIAAVQRGECKIDVFAVIEYSTIYGKRYQNPVRFECIPPGSLPGEWLFRPVGKETEEEIHA